MKKQLLFPVLSLIFISVISINARGQSCPIVPFAVVEVFTSQGCSSCPPAESALNTVIAAEKTSGRNVICIAEHVHYWNNPWVDVFSDVQFSPRQTVYCQYAGVQKGTPEAFVNGKQVVAPSPTVPAINSVINNQLGSGNTPTVGVCISLQSPVNAPTLSVAYNLSGNYSGANIIVCLVEDGLTTIPSSGENSGATLHEDGVSRVFTVTPVSSSSGTINITPPANCIRANSQIVAYVQNPGTMVIYGATRGVDLSTATTGIENTGTLAWTAVFPNPSTGQFTVSGLFSENSQIEVYNPIGERVHAELVSSSRSTIDISKQPKGIYFIKVTDGESSFTQKLIKE
jgi:hypothetical protein